MYWWLLFVSTLFSANIDWSLVGAGGLLGSVVIGVVFMLSHLLQNPYLTAWSKDELKEMLSAIFLITIITSLTTGSNTLLSALTGSNNVQAFIQSKCDDYFTNLSGDLAVYISIGSRLARLSSFYYTATTGFMFYFGKNDAPFMGMGGLREVMSHVGDGIIQGMAIYQFIPLLTFIFTEMGFFTLSLGFALRLIPVLRGAGAVLIAIGFAFAVIYPWMVYVAFNVHDTIVNELAESGTSIHSLITAGELERLNLHIPSSIKKTCGGGFWRWLISISEIGFWAIVCPPFCVATCIGTGPAFPSCFASCMMPFTGLCMAGFSTPLYYKLQLALMVMGTFAARSATNAIKHGIGDPSLYYDIVMHHFVIPVQRATFLALAEFVVPLAITVLSIRSLSEAFGGPLHIVGLSKLV
jgi:hypothetical protein